LKSTSNFPPQIGRLLREAENDRSTDVWLQTEQRTNHFEKSQGFWAKSGQPGDVDADAPRKVMVGVREGHDVTVSGRCFFVCFGCWEGKGDQKSGPAKENLKKKPTLR